MLPPVKQMLAQSTRVKAIIDNPPKVYRHGDAPQNVVKPYVTWEVISGLPDNNLSDVPGSDRYVIQVDCWSGNDSEIEELAKAVRDALEPWAYMTGMPINEREPATKLFRIALQFDWLLSR